MTVRGLNHVTIRCRPRDLPALHRFYTDAIGPSPGWRQLFLRDPIGTRIELTLVGES